MRKLGPAMIALSGICLAPKGTAQQADAPDLAFLEYLGSWQADDDEWVLIAQWDEDHPQKGSSKERDDEDGSGVKSDPKGNKDDD
jgi:hypothetical protein